MKKGLASIVLGAYGGLSFLAYYIKSAIEGTYVDSYGSSYFYGQKNYLVLAIIFLFVAAYGVYSLVVFLRKKSENPMYFPAIIAIDGAIGFFYFLGECIKNGLKGKDFTVGLLVSVFFLLIAFFASFILLEKIKSNQSSNQ